MNWKLLLSILVVCACLMSSSYTMLIPFLPVYLINELNASSDNVSMWSGACFAVTFAISAFAAPLWGKLSDRIGKKPMVIRAAFLLSVSYFIGGIVKTPEQMFLMRAFQGFAAGLWPALLVLTSAYVPKNRLGISMGLMQSSMILGQVAGPLLGGLLSNLVGMRNSFFIGSSVLMFITLCAVFIIKEPDTKEEKTKKAKEDSAIKEILSNKNILSLLIVVFLCNFVLLQIQPIVALYVDKLTNHADNAVLITGLILSLGGLAGAIASPLWGRFGQRAGFAKSLVLALTFAGSFMLVQAVPDDVKYFALTQFLVGLGFSGIFPLANSILVTNTRDNNRGQAFGILFSSQMLGGALGPVIGCVMVTLISFKSVYIISGIILLFCAVFLNKRKQKFEKYSQNQNTD